MRTDDFVTGFLMALALSWIVGYIAGLLSGWFGHRWHAGRAMPYAEPVPMPGMDELRRIEDTIARELAKPDPLDERDMWMALRLHKDVTAAHETGTYFRE